MNKQKQKLVAQAKVVFIGLGILVAVSVVSGFRQGDLSFAAVISLLSSPVDRNDLNLGAIKVRAIVANHDDVSTLYGSDGAKFTAAKINEVNAALTELNKRVKESSYGKARLEWKTSGVHEVGSGICDHPTYGEKLNDLILRALEKEDKITPLEDYTYFLIVHPMPDCGDGEIWSQSGRGNFIPYIINGRTVHLRGMQVTTLSQYILFHELGHSLAYKPGTGISHPDYLNCPITTSGKVVEISITSNCVRLYEWYNDKIVPIYTIMSDKGGYNSDYNAIEKELIGWLSKYKIVTSTNGTYKLIPLEKTGLGKQAIKIPIRDTEYTAYVSFRQPNGYTYPNTIPEKPNGVIIEIVSSRGESFLVTDSTNRDAALVVGKSYRLGATGPYVRVDGILNNKATITISPKVSDQIIPPSSTVPTCSISSDKSSYVVGESIKLTWTSSGARDLRWRQDFSGIESLILSENDLGTSGTEIISASVIGNPVVTLDIDGVGGEGTCSKTINVTN